MCALICAQSSQVVNENLNYDLCLSNIDNKWSNQMANKVNRQLGLTKRSFIIRDRKLLLLLYKSTVKPVLEYGSTKWFPWKRKYHYTKLHIVASW